jgi:DNA relaxase NicK
MLLATDGPTHVAQVGIDWLTVTARTGQADKLLEGSAASYAHTLATGKGHTPKKCSLLGYDGITIGQLFYGRRADGMLARASGASADEFAWVLRTHKGEYHVTRIDLAITVQFPTDREEYGRETAYQIAAAYQRKKEGRQAGISLHRGFGGGDTCSIGARSSSRYLRLYDKTREQHNEVAPNLWRFEVEYKQALAQVTYDTWRVVPDADEYIMRNVKAEFGYHGVQMPFDEVADIDRAKVAADKTSIERSLTWLRAQVRQTVDRLRKEGYEAEVLSALGLDSPAQSE